jgi:two-component system cell cycle sensor histidine kinase/response regulator CckA
MPSNSDASSTTPPSDETILVVDDEDKVRDVAARMLRRQGYHVLEACDGEAALSVSADHPGTIDLVCSDAVMPGMTGVQAVSSLRRDRPTLKAVFMSGYSCDDLLALGLDSSRDPFIQKPFTATTFLRSIRERLDSTA